MASHRSQSNIPMRSGGSSSSNQKTSSTRLPIRSPTPTSLRSEDHAPPSKLVKRRTTRQDGRPQAETAAQTGSRTQKGSAPEIPPRARRPSKGASSTKDLPNLPQQPARLEPPAPQRTPSLVSGSSASTNDSPRSNRTGVLRKKQSIIGQHVSRTRAMAASQSTGSAPSTKEAFQDPFPETVFGITMPSTSSPHLEMEPEPHYEPTFELGLDTSHRFASDMLPPPPLSAISGSPSTRYTGSPFSHSSTPTSMSSYSPGNGLKTTTPLLRQVSPTVNRPPVTKRRTDETASPAESQGLEALKEASSSSSGSTVIEDEVPQARENRRGSRLPAPSPTLAPFDSRLTRTRSSRSSSQSESSQKNPVQRPPEFAHLADAQPMATNKGRPSRPSRDGTSDISGLRQPSPVIQSNLTTLNSNRRMSSGQGQGPVVGSAAATTSKTRLVAPSKASSRNPSPSPNTFHSRGPTPDYPSDSENRPAQAPPPTTPSPSKFSRFGLFRRNKTEPTAPPKEKQSRKGPAAGTGHERYGRYTRRGRSGSVGSTTGSIGRSPSTDSTSGAPLRPTASRKNSMSSKGGDSEMDDFFLDRLTPVVIRGEGSTDGGSTRSPVSSRKGNSMDSTDNGHGPESKMSSAITSAASSRTDLDESRPTLLPSAMPDHSRANSPVKADPSKNTPSLAERRSFRKSQMFDKEKTTVKIPSKIDTRVPPAPSSIDSSFADQSSVPDTANSFADGKEGFWLRPKKDAQPKTQRKAESKPRKWNFFQRSQPASKKKEELSKASAAEEQTVSTRTMPHYAMRDPAAFVDPVDIQQIMREIDAATDSDNQNSSRPSSLGQDQSRSREREPSMLLPPPPKLDTVLMEQQQRSQKSRPGLSRLNTNQSSISSTQSQGIPQQTNASSANNASPSPKVEPPKAPAKPSRLPQVGRIPQVVSQRDGHQPPNQSFSRPFAPNNLGPQQSPDPNLEGAESSKSAITAALDQVTAPSWPNAASFPPEFLAFSPRKNSDISFGSSSGTSYFPAMTAVIPKPGAPSTEDEVWKEYDDLIDEVLTPEEGPKSSTPHQEAKTPTKPSGTPQKVHQLSSPPSTIYKGQFDNIDYSQIPIPDWSMLEPPPQLLSTFRSNGTLDTTGTITNLIASYGERNLSIGTAHGGESRPESTKRDSVTTFRSSVATSIESEPDSDSSPPYTGSSENTKNRYRDTVLMEMAEERNDGKESMANLRFDALMTSKWLSFGRVLFSPVHSELKNSAEDRVLIIDGLGKDWSFYCALTYPGATVFNLGPNPVEASDSEQTGAFSSLPNHRHVHHPDISQPFPFPKGYFNAVVFRFPVATSEATYRFAIYECKRVLRPGGFLEISVLDLDMMNMGNRARRAVRNLKMRMQTNDSSTSLKPASDNIQRLLGRRGFENLNRCMVGVPAAGAIPSSRDNSIDNGRTVNKDARKSISFSDLLTNADKNKDGDDDECITKMVAKVGRWWYTRCYETSTLPDGDLTQSIWADPALLKECEEWQTSFRLLLCYAQKPTITPRRTISV